MANLRPKSNRREKVIHAQERIDYAAYAVEHLAEMMVILRHHTDEQKNALGTEAQSSAKDSQGLVKTVLSLYKQMDCYLDILHPPLMVGAEDQEAKGEESGIMMDDAALCSVEQSALEPATDKDCQTNPTPNKYSKPSYTGSFIQAGEGSHINYPSREDGVPAYRHNGRYKRR